MKRWPPELSQDRSVAIPRLLDDHGGRLYRLGLRFCGNHSDAQDLVQETFLQAYRKWHQYRGDSSVTTWLYTIASRVCQRMHRRRAGQPARMESLEELLPFGSTHMAVLRARGHDPADEAAHRDLLTRAEQAIAGLPVEFRIPLVLKDVIGLSLEDIAAVLGILPDTVKTRLHRARLRVRKDLESRLPSAPAARPKYNRQVCLDLLRAKLESIDRGAPFPVEAKVLCDRCRGLFAELDLGRDLCLELGEGDLPAAVRNVVLKAMRQEEAGHEAAGSRPRGRRRSQRAGAS